MRVEITKQNWKKFQKSNLLPNKDGSKPTSNYAEKTFKTNHKILNDFKSMFDSLEDIKLSRGKNIRYTFGDQLSDVIPNPDGGGNITEREYIVKQGMVPLEMNVIRKMVKALVGVYRQNKLEPIAVSRDRDEQKLGEMMSIAMQYAYQTNNLYETNARGYEEFLNSAIVCYRVGYDYDSNRKMSDVVVELCDINRMAWDDNTTGKYFENISTIGYLHDMTIYQILSRFAKSKQEKEQICHIYNSVAKDVKVAQQFENHDTKKTNLNFYTPYSPDKCRVIEVWSKEAYDSYLCFDPLTADEYTIDMGDERYIIEENEKRIQKAIEIGGDPNEVPLIEYEYKVDQQWVVRYLTPNGYVLHQSVSPYLHGSHPFAIGAYPLINGEIHSLVGDTLNIQRMINRLIMRIEFSRMNAAKGFALIKKRLLSESGLTIDDFLEQWSSPKGAIAMDWDGNEDPIKIYNDSSTNSGDVQMLSTYFSLMDEITGVQGALRGEVAKSGTPSSLYMQQTQNSNNNIADGQDWYNGLIQIRDQKMMSVIQQYFNEERYINIAGKDYSEESKWYNPSKIRKSSFDLSLIQSQSNGVVRMANEQILLRLLEMGAIDPMLYLESTSSPFSDKLLERIKSKQEKMAQNEQNQLENQQVQAVQQQLINNQNGNY